MLLLERMSLTLKGKVLTPVTIKASDVFVHSNSSCKFFLDGKHTSECGTLSYPILKMIDFVNEQSLAAVLSAPQQQEEQQKLIITVNTKVNKFKYYKSADGFKNITPIWFN